MPCPCCDAWPCLRAMAENEARQEAEEDARRQAMADDQDPDLDSLEATPEGQDWTPMTGAPLVDFIMDDPGEAEDGAF